MESRDPRASMILVGRSLLISPLLLALGYGAVAVLYFRNPPLMVFEHLYLVVFVGVTLGVLLMASGRSGSLRLLPHVLAGVLSLQYLFYLLALVGLRFWDDIPTYFIVARFAGDLGHLSESVGLSVGSILGVFLGPPVVVGILLSFLRGSLEAAWSPLRDSWEIVLARRSLAWKAILFLLWCACASVFVRPDVDMDRLGHFANDPIVRFWVLQTQAYPSTPRRVYWAQQDALERLAVKPQRPKVRNVLLFIADSLRGDRLGPAYPRPLTPFLDALVTRYHGRRVPRAFANSFESKGGILSILTSKEVPDISQMNYTLPDFLAEHGARAWLFLSSDHHWYNLKNAYGQSIETYKDGSTDPGPHGICDDEALVQDAETLPRDDGRPHFMYFHLMSAHCAGYFDPRFDRYRPSRSVVDVIAHPRGNLTPEQLAPLINAYDNRVLQTDDYLGRLFEVLERKGYLEDFVAVVTADHGEYLGEGGYLSHVNFSGVPGVAGFRIPMVFLSSKSLPSRLEGGNAYQVDIAPTLADLAGLRPPSVWRGRSLLKTRGPRWLTVMYSKTRSDTADCLLYDSGSATWKYDFLTGAKKGVGTPPAAIDGETLARGRVAPFPPEVFERRAAQAFGGDIPEWERGR